MEFPKNASWPLLRIIIPAYPEINIFSRFASQTTSLGPVSVATAANKVWGWRIVIDDENNFCGPRGEDGLPDHGRLQRENPASVAGFYCGLTSTMDRVFELARLYRNFGAVNIAGGWHAHYCPEEMLNHNFDVVVHGDGEIAIQQILTVLKNNGKFADIPGISFWGDGGQIVRNPPAMLELPDLSELPYPDFSLIEHLRRIKTYPISRVRGCRMNCEFCSVKGKPRWADSRHVFNVVNWLVEKRKAKHFFIVDDRAEENLEGLIRFFEMIFEKYGNSLDFSLQIRLEAAKNIKFLETMKKAGVNTVFVGYESPIDEDLKAMRKGYSSRHMIEWTKILRRYFWVHGMFIFGYPNKQKSVLSASEMAKRFRVFIRKAQISTIMVLHPVPIVGSDLRKRLEREDRLFPWDIVPRSRYDGSYICFESRDMTFAELQETPIKIMKWFYSSWGLFGIILRIIVFPIHWLIKGWQHWHYGWWKDAVKYGGHLLIKQWLKRQKEDQFISRLERYSREKKSNAGSDSGNFPFFGG